MKSRIDEERSIAGLNDRLDTLFLRALDGDDSAFYLLFEALDPKLRRFLSNLIGNAQNGVTAEDLCQESWLRLIGLRNAPAKVQQPFYVQAYLFRVARNLAIDRIRTTKQHSPIDELPEHKHPTSAEHDKSEHSELVRNAFKELSAHDQEVLTLHIELGYRLDEVAQMLGTTHDAMWQRASRARARLRTAVIRLARQSGIDLKELH